MEMNIISVNSSLLDIQYEDSSAEDELFSRYRTNYWKYSSNRRIN